MQPAFTLGVEEEFMVLDPETRELRSHHQRIVELAENELPGQVKAEMHQAVVETGTTICADADAVEEQLRLLRRRIAQIAHHLGLRIGASGTHPFSLWSRQLTTPNPRYDAILHEMQDAARSNLIFGLHVHVGIADKRMAMHIANMMRYFLPHIYALSTNSPFWEGRNTGFKSFRSKVFDKFPRTGMPDYFNSWEEYNHYVNLLIKTGCIDDARKIWWDLRVHSEYPTIEFRIADVCMCVEETVTLAALYQALVVKLYKLREQNLSFMVYSRALINENKWRAGRYGIEGTLIDFGRECEMPARSLILELLDFIDDVVDDLGSRQHVQRVEKMLENGTGADRQLAVYEQTGSLIAVVDHIIENTLSGC